MTWRTRRGEHAVLHTPVPARAWAVLVPGFTGSKEDFIALYQPLFDAGMGVIGFDQRGQYQSPGSAEPDDYRLTSLAEDLRALIDEAHHRLGCTEPPHLLGHSLGGLVCQVAVAGGLAVSSLVLLCSGPGALPPARRGRLADLQAALPDTDLATLWELKRAGERAPGAAEPPPAIAAFLARRWCANDPIGMRAMAQILCTCSDLTDDLAAVVSAADLPVAVIWGAQDDAWPVASQAQLARRLGASATCLPTAGHSPNTEAPAALVTALRETWPLR